MVIDGEGRRLSLVSETGPDSTHSKAQLGSPNGAPRDGDPMTVAARRLATTAVTMLAVIGPWTADAAADPVIAAAGDIACDPNAPGHAPEPGAVNFEIDAGLAFGTGQHDTTAGCLAALDRLEQAAHTTVIWPPRPTDHGPSSGQHQAGTCRMGTDPGRSVTDPYGRVWGHDNLRVVDGSTHVTNGGVNPVLTIYANAFRVMRQWLGSQLSGAPAD